jgi:hypothetical protein
MPKRILLRLRPDSIAEFQFAAKRRFSEASSLAEAGERTGALYLFGYVVEMELKAAYFGIIGFAPRTPIQRADRRNAVGRTKSLGLTWLGNEHDVSSWANLLVLTRRAVPGMAYPIRFERTLLQHARGVSRTWQETIRYHDNMAYEFEVLTVRHAAEWFLQHRNQL